LIILRSNAKQLGLTGTRSSLFYEYLRILKEVKPKYFLLENVRMKKESEKQLNEYLDVEGLHINSELVSYQKRPRIYWTNIPNVKVPKDRNINFQDYKDTNFEYCKQFKVNKTPSRIKMWNEGKGFEGLGTCNNVTHSKKVNCLSRKQDRSPNSGLIEFDGFCRFLTRKELEQAQCVPVGYTNMVSYNQAQDLLGDGWTIDVISHLLKNIGEKNV
jgi:DNA (cytosine-5)-methyltransferase 3A